MSCFLDLAVNSQDLRLFHANFVKSVLTLLRTKYLTLLIH